MTDFYDVAVLGGGPAGAAAAIMLKKQRPELSIALVEASDYSQWRVGEALSPDAGRAFRQLGIWESFLEEKHLHSKGTAAAWETAWIEHNEFIFHPEGKGWHLNRVQFDRWMAEQAAAKGIDLLKGTRYVTHERSQRGILLTLEDASDQYQQEVGMVFDAMGRMSAFVRYEKVQRTAHDRLSGVIGFFNSPVPSSEIATYTLVESAETGWWYSAPLTDQQFVIAFMTDSDMIKRQQLNEPEQYIKLLEQTPHTQQRLQRKELSEPLRILSAASLLTEQVYGDRWIAVGDAASTFDPLSSQGIYKGIRSGMFAAYAAYDLSQGKTDGMEKYQRFIADEFKEYLETKKEYYGRVQRWPEAEFWQRRT